MRILAESLVQVAETFLHPGYGAVSPQPLGVKAGLPSFEQVSLKLDLADALRLQGETLGGAASTSDPAHGPLWVAACCLGLFGAALLLRRIPRPQRGVAAAASLVGLLFVGLVGWSPGRSPPSSTAGPRFANPELATKALLHGVIHDALGVAEAFLERRPVRSLEELRDLVALPTRDLTPGMRHALRSFTLDGWGRRLRLTRGKSRYTVESAGADGKLATADDLSVSPVIHRTTTGSNVIDTVTFAPHAFYLRRHRGEHQLFFYALLNGWDSHALWKARELTGTVLFDLIDEKTLECFRTHRCFEWFEIQSLARARPRRPIDDARAVAALKEIHAALSRQARHEPLILLVP